MQEETLNQQIGIMKEIHRLSSLFIKDSGITLKKYITNYYLPYFTIRSKKYTKSDLYRINIILKYNFTNIDINRINSNDMRLFFSQLEDERKISKATINRYRARLNAIFNHAINNDLLFNNPISKIKQYIEAPRQRCLSEEGITKLLIACKESRNKDLYPIVAIALNTGLRFGEIISLCRDDIHEDELQLKGSITKSGKPRLVPCNDTVKTIIKEQLKTIPSIQEKLFMKPSIKTSFKNALKRAEIKEFRFHDTRRTFATFLKDKNVSIYDIQTILGHCNTTMTSRYLATNSKKLLDSVQKIGFK